MERIVGEDEGKPQSKGKILCNCDCGGPFCNSLIHLCKKPDNHYPQRDEAILEIRNQLREEQRQNLSKILKKHGRSG